MDKKTLAKKTWAARTWQSRMTQWLRQNDDRDVRVVSNYADGLPAIFYMLHSYEDCTYRNKPWVNARTLSQWGCA